MAVVAGDGSVSEATMTQMQELASAWVFKRAIEDNQTWRNWEELKTDKDGSGKTFEEIKVKKNNSAAIIKCILLKNI